MGLQERLEDKHFLLKAIAHWSVLAGNALLSGVIGHSLVGNWICWGYSYTDLLMLGVGSLGLWLFLWKNIRDMSSIFLWIQAVISFIAFNGGLFLAFLSTV